MNYHILEIVLTLIYIGPYPEKLPTGPDHLYRNYQQHKVAKIIELSLPEGCLPPPILPNSSAPFAPILSSTSIVSNISSQLVDVPSVEPMVFYPNPSAIPRKIVCNQHACQRHKNNQTKAKAQVHSLTSRPTSSS